AGDRYVVSAVVAALRCAVYPYTTLFRSRVSRATGHGRGGAVQHRDGLAAGRRVVVRVGGRPGPLGLADLIAADRQGLVGEGDRQDRKRTRLDFSHVEHPYALFFQKKK